jgi:DNA polymerase V
MENNLIFSFSEQCEIDCPMVSSLVQAGFPSPADDYIEASIDLNKHLITHPAATFFVKVEGESMIDAQIMPGDTLIVNRALEPVDGKIVIAVIDGEFTVKRIRRHKKSVWLIADNPRFPPIKFKKIQECHIWGVVTYVIHKA